MDRRYAPPRARVQDTGSTEEAGGQPGNSASFSTRAANSCWVGFGNDTWLCGLCGVLDRNAWHGWVWLILVAVFFLSGGLLLRRSRWARHLMWLSASLYVGVWLYTVVLAMAGTWNTEPRSSTS